MVLITVSSLFALLWELSHVTGASLIIRQCLASSIVIFDLAFSCLFIRAVAGSFRENTTGRFMLSRGWIDLAGSLPLLAFSSLPAVVFIFTGPAGTSTGLSVRVYTLWETLCITGVLRVSRLAGIAMLPDLFPLAMTRRHVFAACRTAVLFSTVVLIIFAPISMISCLGFSSGLPEALLPALRFAGSLSLFSVLAGLLLIYSRDFNMNVSIPLHVMDRGFRRREFYLKAEIRDEFRDDEIYRLAAFYNNSYLPAKMRQNINSQEPPHYNVGINDMKEYIGRKEPE